MAKADWGNKRNCLSCPTKFYDFNRKPILCPSCGKELVLEKPVRIKTNKNNDGKSSKVTSPEKNIIENGIINTNPSYRANPNNAKIPKLTITQINFLFMNSKIDRVPNKRKSGSDNPFNEFWINLGSKRNKHDAIIA